MRSLLIYVYKVTRLKYMYWAFLSYVAFRKGERDGKWLSLLLVCHSTPPFSSIHRCMFYVHTNESPPLGSYGSRPPCLGRPRVTAQAIDFRVRMSSENSLTNCVCVCLKIYAFQIYASPFFSITGNWIVIISMYTGLIVSLQYSNIQEHCFFTRVNFGGGETSTCWNLHIKKSGEHGRSIPFSLLLRQD